jgi:hypothetical protein
MIPGSTRAINHPKRHKIADLSSKAGAQIKSSASDLRSNNFKGLVRAEVTCGSARMSQFGTFRKCRNVRLESGMRTKADVRRLLELMGSHPG